MRYFLGVDGGQSGTTAVIGDETGRVLGMGEAGPCNHAAAAEGRAKLERAVTESVAAACAAAKLDAASIRFEAACFGMSGGPDDKREILAGILRADRLIVTTDAEIALAGRDRKRAGNYRNRGHGVDRLRPQRRRPQRARRRMGLRLWRRRRRFRYRAPGAARGAADGRRMGPGDVAACDAD